MIGRVSIQANAIKCSDVFLEGVDKNKKNVSHPSVLDILTLNKI